LSASTFSPMLKSVASKMLPVGMRRALKRWLGRYGYIGRSTPTSYGCEIIWDDVQPELLRGWQDPLVADRQDAAFAPLLWQMREGRPREDFVALAAALRLTDAMDPLIIEVGCGSAWNSEVLASLWNRPFRYVGVDYSPAMIALAKRHYPRQPYVVGDATALPFRDRACDILLSGTVLMHLLGYHKAMLESRRVARKWCIFHTVPVAAKRPTTILKKFAYGSSVVEVVFNADEFQTLLDKSGLRLREVVKNIPHEYLSEVLCETITARTYVCEIA
jgi:ubiquinone/menaquinone biosynthesis C-methylase UbiE